MQDASLDILHAAGIGPVIAWVDDHLFFHLPRSALTNYNKLHETKARVIAGHSGRVKEKGCWWYKGDMLVDGSIEEFAEDCTHVVRDLVADSLDDCSALHAYGFDHINCITDCLGIPREPSKDTPFSTTPVFLGFTWDLENKTVGLTLAK